MARYYYKILSFNSSEFSRVGESDEYTLTIASTGDEKDSKYMKKSIDNIPDKYVGTINYCLDMRQLGVFCRSNKYNYAQGLPKGDLKDTSKANPQAAKKSEKNANDVNYNRCLGFVPALIMVTIRKDDRKKLYQDGFTLIYEGKCYKYIRYKRSASNARNSQCLFIIQIKDQNKVSLSDRMYEWGSCGFKRDEINEKINPASWEAYSALTLSGIEKTLIRLNKESILLVKDVESVFDDSVGSVRVYYDTVYDPNAESEQTIINTYNLITDNEYINEADSDKREKMISELSTDHSVKVRNKIWDGESLLDNSVFEGIDDYKNNSFALLRARMFKSCAFRTKLQDWFRDNGISKDDKPEDVLNGYTLAKRVGDIKLVITESSLKYLKLCKEYEEDSESDKKPYDEWLKESFIKWLESNTGDSGGTECKYIDFGVVKTDHKSSSMVNTSYQFLNTIGLKEKDAEKLIAPSIKRIKKIVNEPKELKKYLQSVIDNFDYEESKVDDEEEQFDEDIVEMVENRYNYQIRSMARLIEMSEDCMYLDAYKRFLDKYKKSMVKRLIRGKLKIEGLYATLFGNPAEFLYALIKRDSEYNSAEDIQTNLCIADNKYTLLKDNEVYCKRFREGVDLCCARSPHITMGNLFVAKNAKKKQRKFYDTYFSLNEEIIVVNSIKYNLLHKLNGADFDSDTMLVTNNKIIVDAAIYQDKYFNVPVNALDDEIISDKKNKKLTFAPEDLTKLDNGLSGRSLGEIVNLASFLNGAFWNRNPIETWLYNEALSMDMPIDILMKDEENAEDDENVQNDENVQEYENAIADEKAQENERYTTNLLYDEICKLAIMSGAVIDSAKTSTNNSILKKEKNNARIKRDDVRIMADLDQYVINDDSYIAFVEDPSKFKEIEAVNMPFYMEEFPRYYREGILKEKNQKHIYTKRPSSYNEELKAFGKYNYNLLLGLFDKELNEKYNGKLHKKVEGDEVIYYVIMNDFLGTLYKKKVVPFDNFKYREKYLLDYLKKHDVEKIDKLKSMVNSKKIYRDLLKIVFGMNREQYASFVKDSEEKIENVISDTLSELKLNMSKSPEGMIFGFTGRLIIDGSIIALNDTNKIMNIDEKKSYKPAESSKQYCLMGYINDIVHNENFKKADLSDEEKAKAKSINGYSDLFISPKESGGETKYRVADKTLNEIISKVKVANDQYNALFAKGRKDDDTKVYINAETLISNLRRDIRATFATGRFNKEMMVYMLICHLDSDECRGIVKNGEKKSHSKKQSYQSLLLAMIMDEEIMTEDIRKKICKKNKYYYSNM